MVPLQNNSHNKKSADMVSGQNGLINIALDAMGGDHAPESVIKGASQVFKKNNDINFLIYGNKKKISHLLENSGIPSSNYEIHHTDEYVANDEKPTSALRRGKNSSMYLAVEAAKTKKADAVVSAGNTGALMAISKVVLQTLPGIDRPAIGGLFPTQKGLCVMLDLGANLLCAAENLFEFAVMGNSFCRAVLGINRPTVGLLNIGSERSKGHDVLRATCTLIEESGLDMDFYGFVEGNDISLGTTDVVVTDGFSGNIALKTAEGTAKWFMHSIKTTLLKNPFGILGLIIAMPALYFLKKKMDPRNYNGAMLLGLNGIVVKSHGGSDEVGMASAIDVAYKLAKNNINDHITREMVASGHIPPEDGYEFADIDG